MIDVFVHERAICESTKVGNGTRIWAFAHILPEAQIGKDCNICDHVFIENDVIIGDRVTVKSGVQIWDGIRVEDDVFIGPNATFTNDLFPRSKVYPERFLSTMVRQGASIGANATLLANIEIGRNAMIGAGAVVTRNVPPNAIVVGNPAKIKGYTTPLGIHAQNIVDPNGLLVQENEKKTSLGVGTAELWRLPTFRDLRGELVPLEFTKDLPFVPKRQFFVFAVPDDRVRGEHTHRECHQFLVAVSGRLSVVIDDGKQSREIFLNSPKFGLYIPPMTWCIQYRFSKNAILSVYASHPYDSKEYIRDYDEFCTLSTFITQN